MQQLPLPRSTPGAAPPAPRREDLSLGAWAIEEEGRELGEWTSILWRRRWLTGLFLTGVVLAAAVFTLLQTPLYTATATLLIEPTDPQVIDIKHVLSDAFGYEDDYYATQHELLRSRSLAADVIRERQLAKEPAFHDAGSTPLTRLAGIMPLPVETVSRWLGPSAGADSEAWLIERYLDSLGVSPIPDSRLVELRFSSPDPELAAQVTNTHARAYITQGLDLRTRANAEARRFLEERLVELRSRLEAAEAALNEYRREQGIVSLDDRANVVVERFADLNERLTAAEAERIAAEADFRLVGQRSADALPAVLESGVVRTLKEDLARLEGERASLASRFKPGYPQLVRLDAQIAEGRSRLAQEVENVAAGIESAYLAAKSREGELRAQLEAQKTTALRLEDAAVEYAILEHDAETARQLYDSVRQRIQETNVAAELRSSNVFVIDEASPPLEPSSPRTGRNLALALMLGLLGGVGVAFLAEHLDGRLKGPQDVERHLGLASLGVVPDFARADPGRSRRLTANAGNGRGLLAPSKVNAGELIVVDGAPASVSEAYRAIRTSILLSQAGEPPHTILFTSGAEAEGKTTTVLHMALMFARLGAPVLVIDADLRRPSCHRVLGLRNGPGLTEVLAGHEGKVRRLDVQNTELFFLSAGSAPPNPTELLGSQRMRDVLARTRQRFAHVLIDAPSLARVSDSVVLSTLVDGVVLVVDQLRTPRQRAREARARLAYARAKVLGVVLNRCDAEVGAYPELVAETAS
jgi:capsular exopolysaccharide synthesis family protein